MISKELRKRIKHDLFMTTKHSGCVVYEFVKYYSYGYKSYEIIITKNWEIDYHSERVLSDNFSKEIIQMPKTIKQLVTKLVDKERKRYEKISKSI